LGGSETRGALMVAMCLAVIAASRVFSVTTWI
jgi:hypothetical protein